MKSETRDFDWVKSSFLLPADAMLEDDGAIKRIYTTAMQKATDTTMGGDFVLNPLPQFTRYADIKHNVKYNLSARPANQRHKIFESDIVKSNATSFDQSNGIGRVWSEKFHDNFQRIHIRAGNAVFNDLQTFYGNYYSVPAATMARTGRTPGWFYKLGWALGTVASIPMMPFVFASKVARFLMRKPASKYYYLRPAMYPYWNAVSSMLNGIVANMGVIPRPISPSQTMLHDTSMRIDRSDIDQFARILPTYSSKGNIDVFAIAQRPQRLVNARRELFQGELDRLGDYNQVREVMIKRMYGGDIKLARGAQEPAKDLEDYADLWASSMALGQFDDNAAVADSFERVKRGDGWWSQFWKAWEDEARMGSEFVSFRVDFTGQQSESFTSTTKESAIAGQINSIASGARESRFTIADGNVDAAGVTSALVGMFKDFATGALDSIGVQGLAQLSGSAFVDIPKTWDTSSADFNRTTFTVPLRSPYGDPISRIQHIFLPLCAMFALAVPLSTGKQSYTSPFLIELFNQGRSHIRLGMIDSLTITRGVGDVGWNNQGQFLGADMQVSVVDMSSVVHMPLQAAFSMTERAIMGAGYLAGGAAGLFTGSPTAADTGSAVAAATLGSTYDDDNAYTDYLAILAGLPLEAEINTSRKWAVRLARQQAAFDQTLSPQRAAMWATSGIAGELIKAISMSTDRN